jgi:hypothetical protein
MTKPSVLESASDLSPRSHKETHAQSSAGQQEAPCKPSAVDGCRTTVTKATTEMIYRGRGGWGPDDAVLCLQGNAAGAHARGPSRSCASYASLAGPLVQTCK